MRRQEGETAEEYKKRLLDEVNEEIRLGKIEIEKLRAKIVAEGFDPDQDIGIHLTSVSDRITFSDAISGLGDSFLSPEICVLCEFSVLHRKVRKCRSV